MVVGLISQSKFAKMVGVSQQTISKILKVQNLDTSENGHIDLNKTMQSLKELGKIDENGKYIKKSKIIAPDKEIPKKNSGSLALSEGDEIGYKTVANMTREEIEKAELEEKERADIAEKKLKEITDAIADDLDAENMEQDTYDYIKTATFIEAKTRREACNAKLAEFELKLKEGEVIPREEVYHQAFEVTSIIKKGFTALPHKASLLIAGIVGSKYTREIKQLLEEEVENILENLAR